MAFARPVTTVAQSGCTAYSLQLDQAVQAGCTGFAGGAELIALNRR